MHREPSPDDLARAAAGAPPEPIGTMGTTVGTVKYWKVEKGYGAIVSEATSPWDIWCHFGAIDASGFRELIPGERVIVEYTRADQGAFRYLAETVRRTQEAT